MPLTMPYVTGAEMEELREALEERMLVNPNWNLAHPYHDFERITHKWKTHYTNPFLGGAITLAVLLDRVNEDVAGGVVGSLRNDVFHNTLQDLKEHRRRFGNLVVLKYDKTDKIRMHEMVPNRDPELRANWVKYMQKDATIFRRKLLGEKMRAFIIAMITGKLDEFAGVRREEGKFYALVQAGNLGDAHLRQNMFFSYCTSSYISWWLDDLSSLLAFRFIFGRDVEKRDQSQTLIAKQLANILALNMMSAAEVTLHYLVNRKVPADLKIK